MRHSIGLFNRQVEETMSYAHITLVERYQISALMEVGISAKAIALRLGRHKSSIYRELARNQGGRGYRPHQAQVKSELRRQEASSQPKKSADAWEYVKENLEQDWSPNEISGQMKQKKRESVSPEWIYQYVYKDKAAGGRLHEHLRCQKKRRKRYGSGHDRRGQIPNRRDIEERPQVVEERKRRGDWEGDTVVGKNHKGSVVTLVERKSLFVRIKLLPDRKADSVTKAIQECLGKTNHRHTLTVDNGKEFAGHKELEATLGTKVYFAKPYSAWQRGRNEQTNGLIRQYIPKSFDLRQLSNSDIGRIEKKLNHRPRKSLGYRTPHEVFYKTKGVALQS